jgi:hypothetical protein
VGKTIVRGNCKLRRGRFTYSTQIIIMERGGRECGRKERDKETE